MDGLARGGSKFSAVDTSRLGCVRWVRLVDEIGGRLLGNCVSAWS